ncbi:palmitoyltransferase pfa4 [Botrytis cinerea]
MIFLVYGSQIVFHYLEPGSLGTQESVVFNASAWAMIWCYWKTCSVDPGEKGWVNKVASEIEKEEERDEKDVGESQGLEKIEWENVRWSAYPKWTTTVPGPTTASPTPPFPISSASSSTPCSAGLSLFAMSLLFLRTAYSLATNIYMIEAWEIERHDAVIERSQTKNMRGYVYANGGRRVRVQKVEFPFDIGVESAGTWEENGFNDRVGMWPPPDPDKLGRRAGCSGVETIPMEEKVYGSVEEERDAFRQRQEADLKRWKKDDTGHGYYEEDDAEEENEDESEENVSEYEEGLGEEGWTNSEGDRLRDYGVDEEADIVDEDDIPLGELIRRRKARNFESA